MSILQRSIRDLKGVGDQLSAKLAKLQIYTFQDLLFHLPNKYIDRTRIYPIATIRNDEPVVIEGWVEKVAVIPKPKRNLIVNIRDSSGQAQLRFFHFNTQQQQQFTIGKHIRCFGSARLSKSGIQFIHPEYVLFNEGQILPVEEYLTPIYPATEGVSQKLLKKLVTQVFNYLQPIETSLEILPLEIREELQFAPLLQSLQQIHFPTPEIYTQVLNTGRHTAQRQLAFEELLAQHLSLRQKRSQQQKDKAYTVVATDELSQKLLESLPFTITNAQQKAYAIIRNDMAQNYPMLRLVQGDVGSGKTLVALLAALNAITNGLQVALMVPTEILAQQHYNNISKLLAPLNVSTCIMCASIGNKQKALHREEISAGKINLVIGTHALLQDEVQFQKLGLVIIDEQHKFGVAQRLALHKKGSFDGYKAHQLILTATPIPRTLAMTFYADLDYAVIDELPPGRKPITTLLVSDKRRQEVLEKVVKICASGQQVYWVCTLITESEVLDSNAAEDVFAQLQEQLPNLKIALIHARLPNEEKEQIMHYFAIGEINVLVATTVIEVGVDVPNASLMVIENPERLGLAQLHQLRGRVGRGALQSYCVLLYKAPLSQKAMQRLAFLKDSQDGFALAEFDLQLRGPGEVFGTRQSGLANLRIADLVRDKDLLPEVAKTAQTIIQHHSNVISPLLTRWVRTQIEYAEV